MWNSKSVNFLLSLRINIDIVVIPTWNLCDSPSLNILEIKVRMYTYDNERRLCIRNVSNPDLPCGISVCRSSIDFILLSFDTGLAKELYFFMKSDTRKILRKFSLNSRIKSKLWCRKSGNKFEHLFRNYLLVSIWITNIKGVNDL